MPFPIITFKKPIFLIAFFPLMFGRDNNLKTIFLSNEDRQVLNGRVKQIVEYYYVYIDEPATDITNFDEQGNEVEAKRNAGKARESVIKFNSVYSPFGKKTETVGKMENGQAVYKYDKNGYLKKLSYYDLKNKLTDEYVFKCDRLGNVIRTDRYANGAHLEFVFRYKYDSNNLLTESECVWRNGAQALKIANEYVTFDEHNNWLKLRITEQQLFGYQNSTRKDSITRKITYY